jgi:hypothetical protein
VRGRRFVLLGGLLPSAALISRASWQSIDGALLAAMIFLSVSVYSGLLMD